MALTDDQKNLILALSKTYKQELIAEKAGCSQAAVSNYINQHKKDEK